MFRKMMILAMLAMTTVTGWAAEKGEIGDPYGICAHVNRWEFDRAQEEFKLMRQAGIKYVRCDLDWRVLEPKSGTWDFSRWDALTKMANEAGITILPILGYDVKWASPAYRHMNEWLHYVDIAVQRYGKWMPYFEVWNEPNLETFWHEKVDGGNYAKLLIQTYAKIKEIDPKKTVIYGGTSRIPMGFIDASLKGGAGKAFDIMCVHPYRRKDVPESGLSTDIKLLRQLMAKYGAGNKPIWFSEVGYSTAPTPLFYSPIIIGVLRQLKMNPSDTTVIEIADSEYGYYSSGLIFSTKDQFPPLKRIKKITLWKLRTLAPRNNELLILPANESFPMAYKDDLLNYVRRGGNVFFMGGLPLYFDRQKRSDGIEVVQTGKKYVKQFHLDWDTFWTKPGTPSKISKLEYAKGFQDLKKLPFSQGLRFLSTSNLKPGDRFTPILYGVEGNYRGAMVGVYEFNSDLKGKIAVCTSLNSSDTTTDEKQGQLLPRTYIISIANGIGKIFWYSFRSTEWDNGREAHFGIVKRNLSPKPAYHAYATLIRQLPPHSSIPVLYRRSNVWSAAWVRPDGVPVHALWTVSKPTMAEIELTGKLNCAVDHLGNQVKLDLHEGRTRLQLTPGIIYLVGPGKVKFKLVLPR